MGTQGGAIPPSGVQQSAAVTQAPPGSTQLVPLQRGTPTLSGSQVVEPGVWLLPAQQSLGWEHTAASLSLSLQTWPFG